MRESDEGWLECQPSEVIEPRRGDGERIASSRSVLDRFIWVSKGLYASKCFKVGSSSGYLKTKPALASFFGITFWLASNISSAISPNARRAANGGIPSAVGRFSTWPNVLVNSSLVTGFGETTFNAP